MKIEKDKYYLCIRDVEMIATKEIAYYKGKYYKANGNGSLPDDLKGNIPHLWDNEGEIDYYFAPATEKEAEMAKKMQDIAKYIEESVYNRVYSKVPADELRGVIDEVYNTLGNSYNDGKVMRRTIYSEDYDWYGKHGVNARNSHNGIYENCSCVGKVHIVLFNWDVKDYDEGIVEQEMLNTDWSDKVEEYTLYNDSFSKRSLWIFNNFN